MKSWVTRKIDNFDIRQICESGQCFRMRQKDENRYSVIASGCYLEIMREEKSENKREWSFLCEGGEEEFESFWKEYFDLETNYAAYIAQIHPKDTYLRDAAEFGAGIRILKQDLWEMIVSFLISQQNNIVRIRRCIQNVCEKYGEARTNFCGELYYTFPTPEALAELEEDELKVCNLGYRSKYVVRTAKSVASGETELDRIYKMSYREAREELLKFYGVGGKVADCICLFALHQLQAFPVDTHISQALSAHYPRGFPKRRYKGFEGVMQQYIFYWEFSHSGQS